MWRSASVLGTALLAAACGGGGGGSGAASGGDFPGGCPVVGCAIFRTYLHPEDTQRIIAQAVAEAQARGVRAHVAVSDRMGNILAVFSMTGAPATVAITSGKGISGGLDGIGPGTVPATHSAIAKAITGAYLSSGGNAFSTRTAGQIIQEHFNPNEAGQPSGPLFGVQFSQLRCSDVMASHFQAGSVGPNPSPLGLSADPGGLPLYRDGILIGGIGIEANGRYSFDRDITDVDEDDEEVIAVAGASGFSAPADIRGDRITADGRTFRFVDSEAVRSNPAQPPTFEALPGTLVAVPGFKTESPIGEGAPFGFPDSGTTIDSSGPFGASGGSILVGPRGNRFPPRASADGSISAADSQAILSEALAVAKRARGQIRRPLGSSAEVSIAMVDRNGEILGFVRTGDAPVFGIDVAVQKARTALFFSHPDAGAELSALPPANYVNGETASLAAYRDAFRAFTGTDLNGAYAWTPRAIGNLHRPFYPDGIDGGPSGPLSKPSAKWSPFNVGFQLDLVYNQLVQGVVGTPVGNCTGLLKLRNGAQIFPGGVPIYRGDSLVGALGVSGDGVDQDDMIAYLGLANAAAKLSSGLGNAPAARRADTLAPQGVRLRYVQCPQSPFNGSAEQNVCQ